MELDLTRIFVKVVQFGSFSKAAIVLKMPKSTVSRSISRLERETGTKLLVRTTRSLALTQAGRTFYDASLGPITQIEDAQKTLSGIDNLLSGLVRITAPEDLGTYVIAPAIAKLSRQHPSLRFDLRYTDTIIDLVREGFDLAIRVGRIKDSGLKIRRAGEITLVPVASPKYLKGAAKISHPKDLVNHQCLSLGLQESTTKWMLKSGNKTALVPIQPKILSNQMSSLLQMALADGGIALVPTYICRKNIEDKTLIRILPEWSNPGWPISMLTPLSPSSSARLKVTTDQLMDEFKLLEKLANNT